MIRFRCHRCKRPIAAPDGYVGRKVKCPGCMIVTIVPDIPGAADAKARAMARPQREQAAPAAPAPPQGPPDPLDELAAAVSGDIETAYDDDGGAEPAAWDESADSSDAYSPGPRSRRPRRRYESRGRGASTVDVIICVLLPVIGLILAALRSSTDRKASSQMMTLSIVMIVLNTIVAVILALVRR